MKNPTSICSYPKISANQELVSLKNFTKRVRHLCEYLL